MNKIDQEASFLLNDRFKKKGEGVLTVSQQLEEYSRIINEENPEIKKLSSKLIYSDPYKYMEKLGKVEADGLREK